MELVDRLQQGLARGIGLTVRGDRVGERDVGGDAIGVQRGRQSGPVAQLADGDIDVAIGNAESSAGLKVRHAEPAVLAVIRAGILVGSFS
jgi:hypothetical protein